MSYEYKDEIIEDVKAHCKAQNKNIAVYPVYHFEDKVEEIHNVYAQSAKADEYEAKAKAFDRIVKESKETFSCGDFCDDVRHIINSYEIGVAKDD